MELLTPPSFLLDSKWVQGENLQFQVPSTCHHPSIFCLILTHSTELHLIDWNKLHPLPVCYHWKTLKYWTCVSLHLDIVLWKLTQAFVSALSTILFASSDLGHFYCFYNQYDCVDNYCRFKWSYGSPNEPPGSEKYQHIWLLSFSLYNKWFNLKRTREISVFNAQGTATVKRVSAKPMMPWRV